MYSACITYADVAVFYDEPATEARVPLDELPLSVLELVSQPRPVCTGICFKVTVLKGKILLCEIKTLYRWFLHVHKILMLDIKFYEYALLA